MQNGAAAYTGAPFCTSQSILFGTFLVHLTVHLYRTYFWTHLDALGRFGIDLGPPLGALWSPLGPLWKLLGALGSISGLPWALFGRPWDLCGSFWALGQRLASFLTDLGHP